jgi:hypothetical protein
VCKGWCRYCGTVREGGSAVMVMIISWQCLCFGAARAMPTLAAVFFGAARAMPTLAAR